MIIWSGTIICMSLKKFNTAVVLYHLHACYDIQTWFGVTFVNSALNLPGHGKGYGGGGGGGHGKGQ